MTTLSRTGNGLASAGKHYYGGSPSLVLEINAASLSDYHARAQRRFVVITLLSCFMLQRFAYVPGATTTSPISVVTPIVGLMTFWYLWTGVLTFDRKRVGIMAGLIGIALFSLSLQKNMPIAMVTRNSLVSLIYWLGITGFFTVRFARPMDERIFFKLLIYCLAFIAVAGIAEFMLQFVGIKLFTFSGFLPPRFSTEPLYNVVIPLGSRIIKSNGFFLVEPSVFSQFMALGLVCEWLNRRRTLWLLLFLFALFCSASGTGFLVVGAFVGYSALTKGGRGLGIAMMFAIACLVGFVIFSMVFPEITNSLSGRVGEIGQQGTSGNERFVTPFLVLRQVLHVAPYAFFTGIGPGGSDSLAGVTYVYTMNTPTKIILEYGIFGLLFYVTLILCNRRTTLQNNLLPSILVLLLFAGAYEHFPPILFPVVLIATVVNLTREPEDRRLISTNVPGSSSYALAVR